ncbi:hypothetical protein VFPFJ_11334 [Purpureocillium lilacinum]|uniref:Uncharacterized protein n=1 Tax=Purpureocillium lilacinum TaxID=33203 RepID=A0A179FFV1_PURLI|nr:hypothetical protein VFPFJ_11334 [Purpureocillium lilacinum]OAQ63873.1 hypothetical protein VFPFJ_11334 [Purpureocillium lilacinum]
MVKEWPFRAYKASGRVTSTHFFLAVCSTEQSGFITIIGTDVLLESHDSASTWMSLLSRDSIRSRYIVQLTLYIKGLLTARGNVVLFRGWVVYGAGATPAGRICEALYNGDVRHNTNHSCLRCMQYLRVRMTNSQEECNDSGRQEVLGTPCVVYTTTSWITKVSLKRSRLRGT